MSVNEFLSFVLSAFRIKNLVHTCKIYLLPFQDAESDNNDDKQQLGELFFSLNYLPTAERLTVVIGKAKNLRDINGEVPKSTFVMQTFLLFWKYLWILKHIPTLFMNILINEMFLTACPKYSNYGDISWIVDVMVRVYLVQGAKISRKKTSTKSAIDGSIAFNESMIFSLTQNNISVSVLVVVPNAQYIATMAVCVHTIHYYHFRPA